MNKKGYINTTTKVTRVVKNREGEKSITTLGMGLHRGEKTGGHKTMHFARRQASLPTPPLKKTSRLQPF